MAGPVSARTFAQNPLLFPLINPHSLLHRPCQVGACMAGSKRLADLSMVQGGAGCRARRCMHIFCILHALPVARHTHQHRHRLAVLCHVNCCGDSVSCLCGLVWGVPDSMSGKCLASFGVCTFGCCFGLVNKDCLVLARQGGRSTVVFCTFCIV